MVLKHAISLIGKGRKREAQAILTKLIRSDPHEVQAWFWYVETLDSPEDRIRLLQACRNANPGDREVSQALGLLQAHKPASVAAAEAPPARSPRPEASRDSEAASFAGYGKTVYVESPYIYEPEEERQTDPETGASFPNIDVPANQQVLAFLGTDSHNARIAPYQSILGPNSAPNLVDAVDYFMRRAEQLPQNAKYLVYHCPALVHPGTGIIFGFVKGDTRYYRLPEKTIRELSSRKLAADHQLDRPGLGKDWVVDLMVKDHLISKSFAYYGSSSNPRAAFPLHLEEDLFIPKFDWAKRLIHGLYVVAFLVAVGLLVAFAAYPK